MISDVDGDCVVYLNGQYLRLADAKISVLDRGFIFGDGIYEVVPFYKGKPFRMDEHLGRLERSLASIGIDPGFSRDDWRALVTEMAARTAHAYFTIYLQVTRGPAKRDHAFPEAPTPTVFCMASPFTPPSAQQREQGLTAISVPDVRWLRCEIKSISLLGNVLAKQQAVEAGVDEVVQFRDGFLTEGASCNVWVVRNGVLLAPPLNNLILEGVRYRFLEQLAAQKGIAFEARKISQDEVAQADEIMLSSATKEVLPVVQYNGRPVGSGKPGPIYAALRSAYDQILG
ncbi:MAG TPA: D-amino acid aminotransferase [Pusillimonas sp.]|uniref:D-amino acid aminotransferase n=1 Tax=Pusillimonas sp. TaxID=3040095 RepID=UPI002B9FB81B|nr:D-amino acid aminotransferase [Pusillimonas sp.]HUH86530.1 D-amino acid aminotransferase [Pusillimonas sp.]